MKVKSLFTMGLVGTLLVGTIVSANAAEFDAAWYAKQNPDVVAELGDSPEAMKLHYEMFGRKEARMANEKDVEARLRRLFDAEEYAKLYPDVKDFYGEDAEAMFQHYISYGLLEARRPSEQVPQGVASSLRDAVKKAMTDAGVEAAPGSALLVAVITGETAQATAAVVDAAELTKVTQALEQVSAVVEEAVAEAAEETYNPKPAPSSGGGESEPVITKTVSLYLYGSVSNNGSNKLSVSGGSPVSIAATVSTNNAVSGQTWEATVDNVKCLSDNNKFYFAIGVPKSCRVSDNDKIWLKNSSWGDASTHTLSGGDTSKYYYAVVSVDDTSVNEKTIEIALATVSPATTDSGAQYFTITVKFDKENMLTAQLEDEGQEVQMLSLRRNQGGDEDVIEDEVEDEDVDVDLEEDIEEVVDDETP